MKFIRLLTSSSFIFKNAILLLIIFSDAMIFSENISHNSETIFAPHFGIRTVPEGESLSGIGSNMENTRVIRQEIPKLLRELGCKTMLDLPCGDFYWMKEVNLPLDLYIGADCIKELINLHIHQYSNSNRIFIHLDALTQDIPKVDLILCRDMLIHFSNNDVMKFINKIKKSGSRYLLTTHFTSFHQNENIPTPCCRSINLTLPPFNFPEPEIIIVENYTEIGKSITDRTLSLWDIDSIPNFP